MGPVVDAHQHFWTYGTYRTSWMEAPPYAGDSALRPLRRSFGPDVLAPELQAAGVHYTVAIEAADGPAENEALLGNARSHRWIAGVVGWVPLVSPTEVARALDAYANEPAFVGVRHLVNVEPDPDWILRPNVFICCPGRWGASSKLVNVSTYVRHIKPSMLTLLPDPLPGTTTRKPATW
jgi:L-fuconolactonase